MSTKLGTPVAPARLATWAGSLVRTRSRGVGRVGDLAHPRLTQRRTDLDALRAIAATLVVLFHLRFTPDGADLGPLSAGGFPGVAIFFALSGYLITRSATGPVGRYTALRVGRLWPAYIAALVGLTWFAGATQFIDHPLAYLTLTQNYDVATYHKLITPAWTLAIEVAFYVVAPVLVRLPLKVSVIAGGASLAIWLTMFRVMPTVAFEDFRILGTAPFMFWLFVPGIVVARVDLPQRGVLWLGIALVVASLFADELTGDARGRLTVAFGAAALGSALLIVARPRIPFGRLWSAAAAISYSVYLWHHDLLFLLGPWGALAAVGVAAIVYLAIEAPALSWIRNRLDRGDLDERGHERRHHAGAGLDRARA